jgi:hypothetical protein
MASVAITSQVISPCGPSCAWIMAEPAPPCRVPPRGCHRCPFGPLMPFHKIRHLCSGRSSMRPAPCTERMAQRRERGQRPVAQAVNAQVGGGIVSGATLGVCSQFRREFVRSARRPAMQRPCESADAVQTLEELERLLTDLAGAQFAAAMAKKQVLFVPAQGLSSRMQYLEHNPTGRLPLRMRDREATHCRIAAHRRRYAGLSGCE